jgi:glycosyltransferase involved in cell wall biosynthesis
MFRKHIVYVTYNYWPPKFGGELLIATERFKGLVERGFRVTVLTSGNPGFDGKEEDEGLLILRSPRVGNSRLARLFRRILYFFWVCSHLFQLFFDVYYQGDSGGIDESTAALSIWIFTQIAKIKKSQRIIVHSLADNEANVFDYLGWSGLWRKFVFHCFTNVVAVSPALYCGLQELFTNKVILIINGVRDDIFIPLSPIERVNFRLKHDVHTDDVIFSFVGSIGTRKGFDQLANAFRDLAKVHPNWKLWVIGPHTIKESQNLRGEDISACIAPLHGLGCQVVFWGRINDRKYMNQILASSDIFVFPTRREGMPLAPAEAMSAGIPVIITRIAGVTDLINIEGETGLYIPVGEKDALRSAMEKLGNDPALRHYMGENGRKRIMEGFRWEKHLDQWEQLYLGSKT